MRPELRLVTHVVLRRFPRSWVTHAWMAAANDWTTDGAA